MFTHQQGFLMCYLSEKFSSLETSLMNITCRSKPNKLTQNEPFETKSTFHFLFQRLAKNQPKIKCETKLKKAIWLLKPSTFISTLHHLWSHSSFRVILWLCFQSCSSIKYRWKFVKKNCWTYKSQENTNALKCWKGITKFVDPKCKQLSFHVVFHMTQ